ncbi:YDG domain-containing protein, partial [Limnohabitans sp.]|uniref:YDG domain-containing protein n=1 Tax=Limnohabitans sp. TaxID=1907725 RepID=UPI0031FCFE71
MNALCYKTVFSKRLGALVAVGEHACNQSKGQGAGASSGAAAWDLGSVLRYVGVLTWGFAAVSLAWSQTLPQGGRVSQGQVTISQSGQQMAITQSTTKAVVNWDSFDIGANAKVNIAQPSSQSVLLNRVLSDNPTQILGQLQANGQVVLVNPKGIVVGSDGSVSASAFTASTLNISDADFMAGNGRYTREGSTGEVVNKGRINVAPGGYVALLGARVSNEGQIIAPQGAVALGAAETVTVPIGRTGKIKLELTPASINASVANQKGGVIVAEGGQVYMQAAALGQAVASVLHSGHIDTSGAQAGAVHVLADGGQIKVDGSITANSSGQDDQGQLRKGGDIFIGRDEETGVLARTTDASGAQLESQRGFVETSGDHLVTTGTRVKAGEWLLDPTNITIGTTASGTTYTDPNGTGGSYTYEAGATSFVRASDIQASLNDGTSVTIATSSGTGAGDININSNIAKTSGSFASLTLRAHNDIVVAANTTITSTSGNLNVTLNSDFDASGAGAIVMNSGSGITSNGGNITLGGGSAGSGTGYAFGYSVSGRYTGVDLTGSTLSANGGNIRIKGQGTTAFTNTSDMRGVNLSGAVLSTSGVGNIQIDGIGGNGNVSSTNVGIGLTNGTTITGSSGGTVSLTGTGGNGTLYNFGVWLSGSTVKITSPGAISLNGTAGGSGTSGTNSGVMVQGSAMVEATGSGSVSVVGVGGTTTGNFDHGVEITSGGSVRSQTGSIQITGSLRDSSTTESGIYLGGTGTVASSGNGAVTLTTDSLGMASTSNLSAGTGTVTVQTRTASTLLDVGGTSADATSGTLKLGISSAELARISAGTVVLGRNDATANTTLNAIDMGAMGNPSTNLTVLGNHITVNDNVTKTAGTDATLSLRARGDISVAANKTITSTSGKLNVVLNSNSNGNNAGAIVMNSGSGITSNGGDIRLSGGTVDVSPWSWAYGTATSPHGISLTGTDLSAGGGNINLRGASRTVNELAHGVHINGGTISTTGGGFIDIQGHSTGTNQFSSGVAVLGASITGGSTNNTRLIGTNASAGTEGRYQGVWLNNNLAGVSALVTSSGGSVTVTGTGGGGGASGVNYGVVIENGLLSSGGTGTVNVTGTGGTTTGPNNAGVSINGTAASPIGISSNGGTINVTGTGGAGGLGQGIWFVSGRNGNIQSGNNAAINLTTDSFVMESGAINAGSGMVTIQNRTTGTLVDVGGADVLSGTPLTLGVSNAEINRVSAGTLKIGSTTAGNLNVSSAITSAASTGNLYLQTNGTATASASVASGAGLFMQTTGLGISNIAGATLTGTHISLDNTRGVINLSTGAITKGTRTRIPTGPAIMIAEHVTASGNLNLYGQTPNNEGILLWSGKELSGGNIQAVGEAGNTYGVKLNAGASITTTGSSGNSMVKGLAAGVATNGQAALQTANATLRAAAGTTLTLHGHATTVAEDSNTNNRGLRIDGLIDTYGAITLTGDSGSNDGFLLQEGGINVRTGSLNINGSLMAQGGGWRSGVNISKPIQLYNGTSLTVVGQAQNTGVMTADKPEWGTRIDAAIGQAAGQTTAGDVSITGYTSSAQDSEGVLSNNNISTGTGNITIVGQNLGGSNSAAIRFQGNLSTSGNITLQSVGGHILVPQTKTIGTTTSDVVFTGRNITLDNTGAGLSSFINDTTGGLNLTAGQSMGGSLNATTGGIAAGSGLRTDASNSFGVRVNARMEASGNIHLQGNTNGISTNGVIVNPTGRLVSSGLAAQIKVNSNQRVVNTGAIRTSNTSSTDALIQLSGSQIESTGTLDTDGAGRLLASASAGQVGVSSASITGSVSASATGDISITNSGAIAFSAVTTNNGHITLNNTQGALSIDSVNGVAGVSAHGTGNVNLTATSPGDVGIWIKRDVSGHDVSLSGTANGSVNGDGIKNSARALTSRGDMSLTGVASLSGMGIYAYAGSMTSAGRIELDGTGTSNHGINLHGNALITSTGSWAQTETAVHLKGTSNNAAVSLNGVNIQNNSTKGTTHVEALNGRLETQVTDFSNVIAHASTAGQVVMSTDGGHLNLNTRLGITQNSNEGVLIKTLGNGNLTAPKIDNQGTGGVVVAAGSNLTAGTGTGGQVLTLSGNSITQHNTGTTYIYSGQTSGTGQLNHLNSNFSNLYYQGTSQALNTQFNTAYDGTPSNDLVAPVGGSVSGVGQVFFRSNTRPGFSITLNDVSKTYGDADPGNAALNTRLGNAYTGPATLSTTVNGNNFAVAAADVIQGLTGTARNAGNNVGTYAYTNISGSAFNTTLTAQPHLVINKANLSLSGTRVYDAGTTYAGQFLTATGVLGETFSVTGLGDASNLSSANVQSNQTLSSLTGLSLGSSSNGGLSTNYNTLSTTGSSVSVTPRTLTVTGANNTVTYNGAAQTNTGATIAGKQGSDDFSISGYGSGTNASNTAYADNLSVAAVGGTLLSNYSISYTQGGLTIGKANLTATGSKVYDAGTAFAGTNFSSIAGINGETFTATGSGTLASPNVQSAQTLQSLGTLSLVGVNGALASNYNWTTANTSVSVTPRTLTVTGANNTVTYNGAAQTNTGATIAGNQGSDSFSISGYGSGTNASTTAYADSLSLTGTGNTLLSNYSITYNNGGLTIGKANLTAMGSKVYDASTAFAGSSFSSIAGVNGETFTATGSGTLNSPNVQSAQTLQSLGTLSLVGVNGALASNYNWTTANTSASVTPRSLSVTGANNTITYNGAAQTNTGATIVGTQSGDSFTISGYGTGTNASTTAYADNLSVAAVGGTLLSNYSISYTQGGLTIGKANLTVTGVNNTVTYNGSAQTNSGATIVGTQSGDGFSISGYAAGTNAGSYNDSLTLTGTGGTLLSNYSIAYTHGGLNIDKANLTLSGTRVYDAGTTFAGQYLTASGVAGQTFSVTGSGHATNLASKNVQTSQPLSSVTGLNLGSSSNGGQSSNYNALSTTGSSVSVTPKALTATATASDKTYNATLQATVSGTASADIIGSDNVVIGHTTASFADANVARDGAGQAVTKTVSVSGLSLSGTDALNYSLQNTSATASAKITPQSVSLSSLTAANKVYDGNVKANITDASFSGTVNGETLSLSGTEAGSFANKNVGTAKVVSVADVSALSPVDGTGSWNNYQMSTTGAFTTSANITPKNVTIASLTASNKTYDGNTNATITAGVITTGVGTETLGVSGTGTFNNKNAGDNKTVTVDDVTALTRVDGTGVWSNYNLNQTGALSTTASIAPKAITLSGITAVNKVYDGDTAATASTMGAVFDGKITGDALTVQSTGVFADKNVGQLKNVSLSHVLGGADLGNYTISAQTSTTASITPKSASVSATFTQLTYNGAVQNQSTETRSGFVAGDTITVAGQASGKNAGTYGSSLVVSGQDATNYNITVNNANLVIDKVNLTVTANAVTKTYDATLNASGTGTVGTLAGAGAGDVVNSAGTQAFLNANAGTNKQVRASGVTIKDASNADMTANYTINYVDNTTSVINKAALTVKANDDARFVGLADNVNFAGVQYAGLVGGETSSVLGGTLLVERNDAGNGAAGVYTGALTPKGLASNNYEIAYTNGTLTIVPADQLLISTTNQSVTYGTAPTYVTTAKYLKTDNTTIITLTGTGTGNDYTFSDGLGTTVRAVLKPYAGNTLASLSSTDHTVVGNYAIKDLSPTVTGGNFVGAPVFVGNLSVNTKAVTPNATGVSKVYDGTTAMSNVVVGLTGEVTGDKLSINGTGAFSQKNVGSSLNYTISNITLGGDDAGNYHLSGMSNSLTGSNGSITRAPLVLTSANVVKTYDRSTSASGTAVATNGTQLFGSDSLSGGTFVFDNKNAGTGNKVVSLSGVTVGDGNSGGNYTVSYVDNTTSTIWAKHLTASYSADNKTYNGNTLASVTGSSADIISGDTVSLSHSSATFANKDVGTNKTVTVNGIALGGADAGNYSLQNTSATSTANISAKSLTVSYTASHKVYDGLTHASVSGSSSDIVSGDNLGFTQTAHFEDKNAANGKGVSITQIGLSGADAGNYALAFTTASASANITPKDVSLSSITAAHKVYDGNNSASITAGAISTGVSGETLAISGSGIFSDANAANGKTVTVANVSALNKANGSGDWSNYNLTTTGSLTTTANITRKDVTLSSITAADKVYDGNNTATITSGNIATGVGTQTLAIGGVGTFSNKDAANNKTVTVTDVTALTQTDGTGSWNNYNLTTTGGLTTAANITRKNVTLTSIAASNKAYDGSDAASIASGVVTGTVGTETLSVSGVGLGSFSDKNAVNGKTVTVADVSALTRVNGANGGDWSNYQLTTSGPMTTQANITRKDVSLSSITADNKVYDGFNTATITSGVISTGVGSETLAISGQGTFSDANAADNKVVTVAQTSTLTQTDGSGSWSNYRLTTAGPITTTANITRKNVSLSSITAAHKVYNGSDAAAITTGVVLGTVGTESLSVSGVGSFSDANAADGKTVSVTDVTALTKANGSGNWSNYNLTTTGAMTTQANITRKDVSLSSITALDKVYDGNNTATITSGAISTGVGSETLAISGSGTFADANAANGKTVTVANVTALTKANGTGNWSNYNLTTTGALTTTADISRKDVTLTSITAAHKVYDGNNTATITSGAINTGVGTETLGVNGSGTFSDANAGDGKTVTVANVTALTKANGSGNWNNYNLITTGGLTTTANITRKDVSLSSITALDKVYDGNNTATITSGAISTGVGSETLAISGSGTFSDANAADGKTVSVTDVTALTKANGSGNWNNYNLTTTGTLTTTANITRKDVSLSGITALDKVYDGNNTASITSASGAISTGVGSETLGVTGSGTFSDANAANNKTVTVSDVTALTKTNGTGDWNNYNLTTTGALTTTANITRKDVSLSSITALDKVYDGNNTATITSGAISTGVGSETLAISGSGTFSDANAANNKTVTVANVSTLTKANGTGNWNNYNLTTTGAMTTQANITRKDVSLSSITALDKVYDGNNTATITSGAISTGVSGETLAISGSGTFSNANAADGKTVTVDNVAALTKANGTGNWDNYNLTTTGALTTTANITRKDVSLSSITAAHKVYDGNNTASITSASGAISTGVGSETLGVTGSGTFSDANAANNKTVTVSDVTALTKTNGTGDWNNYNLTTTGALTTTANITRKDVSLSSITALDKVYDGNNTATITSGAISTGVGSETLAISGSGTFSDANAANNKTVTVANVSTLAKANGTGNWSNYNLTTTGVMTTTADITRKNVTLDSITAADKVYDGTAVASITGGSVSGTLTGESLSVSGQGSFADKHVASNKTVTVQDVLTLSRDNGTGDWRNYQLITTGALTDQANITPKALSVSGITAAPKTYDGNTQATVATSAVVWDGRVAGDNLSLSSTGAFSDKNVGNAKVVTLTHTLGGTDLGNYTVTTQASTTANITPKALALSAGPVSKTYDGSLSYSTSAADLTALSAQLVSGDTVTAASLVFTDKNAGSGNKSITFNSATLEDGNNGGNYTLTLVGNNTSTIDKANITVALQGSVEKTYDGLDSATVNSAHFATSGWVSGEGASITQTAAVYANQNVSANPGNGTVSANLQLSDYAAQANTDLNNYSLASSASGAVGKINPAALNIKVNDTKMFVTQDANLAFDQGFSYTGLVNGESAANALTGGAPGAGERSYTGAQFPGVGSLNGVYGLSTTPTALNGNYSVSVTPGNLQVIPADKLLVTISSQSDAYGQRKAPQAGVAASGTVTAQYCLVQSNCNGANLYTLNLNSSNGSNWQGTDNTGNTITLGTGLAGTPTYSSGGFLNAGNHTYALASLSSTVANQFNGHEVNGGVLTITPLQMSLNASDVTKVYDGNNTLVSATLSPSDTLLGDALQATFVSGSFTDKNAGAQGFTLSGLALQGADQANYVLGNAQFSGTGTITPKAITVSGLQAQDKVYDGSTQASVQTSGALFNGIVAGDQLSVTATGQFDTRHAGTHKAVSLSSSFGGADLDNYSITPQASSTASITPAPLVVTASAARKTYDGNTTAPGVGTVGALAGAAAGDTVAFAGTQTFTNKNAGTGKTVTVTGVRLVDGSNTDVSGNYAITYV